MDIITVSQMIQEVRDQSGETNEVSLTDAAILRSLNRGLRTAASMLAKHYPDRLLDRYPLDLSDGAIHDIPENCLEDRVEYIEISAPGYPSETRRRSFRESTRLSASGPTSIPFAWYVEGRQIRFAQTPTGAYDATAWFLRRPERLTVDQGRVTALGADWLIVDVRGTDLSPQGDQLSSYINVVDAQTGAVKGTWQILSIADQKLTLRATPIRSSVQGRPVESATTLAAAGVELDDYVCLHEGTCVPEFQDALAAYLVQWAVADAARALDRDSRLESQVLQLAETQVRTEGLGREGSDRIRSRSQNWPTVWRRWPIAGSTP